MSIELKPKPKHRIPVGKGAQMTARYRAQRKKLLRGDFKDKDDVLPICETFDKEAVERLLCQPGCTGLRVYYSMDEEDRLHAVLVGVDAENRDILAVSSSLTTMEEEGEVLDEAQRCPTNCPPDSDLNTDK